MTIRTFTIAALCAAVLAGPAASARKAPPPCDGPANFLESGSALLLDTTPVMIVAARPGRCLLILSGWDIEADGSGSVNIGDADVTSSGTGGFVPPTLDAVELATEDELWAVRRDGHDAQVITWIELYD
jgi:hypothetical protein